MKHWGIAALLIGASGVALAQSKVGSFVDGFNKGYADSQQRRAMEQQEKLLEEQARRMRLEMRERSGLQNLRALESADRASNQRLAEVLAQIARQQ